MASLKLMCTLLALSTYFHCALPLSILGLFPYQGKSHFFVFKVYLEELAKRGHEVTVVSHFPDPSTTYQDISLAGTAEIMAEVMPFQEPTLAFTAWTSYALAEISIDNCEKLLAAEEVQNLWKTNQKFDLVVTEQFNSDCTLGVAHYLGAPVVTLTSHILLPYHYSRLGVPDNVAFVPNHFFGSGSRPSFIERMKISVFNIYCNLMYRYLNQRSNQQTLERYFGPIPDLDELAKQVKFTLLYHYFPLTGSRLFPPNVIEVGGYHVAAVKPLPEDLRRFIEESPYGVVYVSFGSLVKTTTITSDKLDAIIGALASLQQRVIWKWENDTLPGAPENILVRKWLPQNDILAHPNVLAFYSHGGMLGMSEALHHGVPLVVTPVLGDQPANAAAARECGLGETLSVSDLSEQALRAALLRALSVEARQRARRVSRAWLDRPLPPLEVAVFWTEFAARHPELSFPAHALDVPLVRYYSLDLLAAAAALFAALLVLTRMICRCNDRRHLSSDPAPRRMEKSKKRAKKD